MARNFIVWSKLVFDLATEKDGDYRVSFVLNFEDLTDTRQTRFGPVGGAAGDQSDF